MRTKHSRIIFKPAVLVFLFIQSSFASTYTLNSILESMTHNDTLSKVLKQQSLALEAKNKADTASEPLEVFVEGTRANPFIGKSGNEYAVGVTKNIMLGSIQDDERKITRLSNQAYLLEEEKNILNFINTIKNIYHQHCLDQDNYRSSNRNHQDFKKLFQKKQKAYQYQEISKIELMQLEIEKNNLYTQLQEIKMRKETSKKNLLMLSNIAYNPDAKLSCQDMYPISANVKLENTFELSNEAHDKRVQSTHQALERYSNHIDSIGISAQYTEELDMDKYTVGLSIPLNFTSSKNEEERAAAMYENSAITLKHEQLIKEKTSLLIQLKSQLKNSVLTLKSLENNYRNYQQNLLPLMKKSYDLGEISVVEYILTKQRSYQFKEEIYNTKKSYYDTLFKLYTLSEKKDK